MTGVPLDAEGQINALPAKTNTQLHWQISHKCPRTTTDGGLKKQCRLLHHSVLDSRFILKCIKTAPTAGNSTPQKLHSTAQHRASQNALLIPSLSFAQKKFSTMDREQPDRTNCISTAVLYEEIGHKKSLVRHYNTTFLLAGSLIPDEKRKVKEEKKKKSGLTASYSLFPRQSSQYGVKAASNRDWSCTAYKTRAWSCTGCTFREVCGEVIFSYHFLYQQPQSIIQSGFLSWSDNLVDVSHRVTCECGKKKWYCTL